MRQTTAYRLSLVKKKYEKYRSKKEFGVEKHTHAWCVRKVVSETGYSIDYIENIVFNRIKFETPQTLF